MRPASAPSVKFTYEDFLNFPDDGMRHEIIDGDHFVTPSPNTKHQAVATNLILSPGTRKTDEITKRRLYERSDVQEYWIVDPELDAIKIYRRVEGTFARVAELSAERGDSLTTPLLPRFASSLTAIFAPPI